MTGTHRHQGPERRIPCTLMIYAETTPLSGALVLELLE